MARSHCSSARFGVDEFLRDAIAHVAVDRVDVRRRGAGVPAGRWSPSPTRRGCGRSSSTWWTTRFGTARQAAACRCSRLRREPSGLRLEVCDEGPGIAARRARTGLPALHPWRHLRRWHRTRPGDRAVGRRIARRRNRSHRRPDGMPDRRSPSRNRPTAGGSGMTTMVSRLVRMLPPPPPAARSAAAAATANRAGRCGRAGSGRSTRWPRRRGACCWPPLVRGAARHRAVAAVGAEHRLSRRRGDGLRRRIRHRASAAHPCANGSGIGLTLALLAVSAAARRGVARRALHHGGVAGRLVHARRRSHLDRGVHRAVRRRGCLAGAGTGWVRRAVRAVPRRAYRRFPSSAGPPPSSAVTVIARAGVRRSVRRGRPGVRAPGRQPDARAARSTSSSRARRLRGSSWPSCWTAAT